VAAIPFTTALRADLGLSYLRSVYKSPPDAPVKPHPVESVRQPGDVRARNGKLLLVFVQGVRDGGSLIESGNASRVTKNQFAR